MIKHLIDQIKEDRKRPVCVLIINNNSYYPELMDKLFIKKTPKFYKIYCSEELCLYSIYFMLDLNRMGEDYNYFAKF